jgi:hypothetical protein
MTLSTTLAESLCNFISTSKQERSQVKLTFPPFPRPDMFYSVDVESVEVDDDGERKSAE